VEAWISALPPPAPGFSWVASAWAEEGPGEVLLAVRRGRLKVLSGARRTILGPGQGMRLRGEAWSEDPRLSGRAWWGRGGWKGIVSTPVLLRDSARDFPEIPAGRDFVLEALVRKRDPSAELGLRIPFKGRTYEVPVGASLKGEGRVRVEVASGCCLAWAGGDCLVRCRLEDLGDRASEGAGSGVGLRAWGGDLEIREVRCRY
jgi:hypothetical protein